MPMLMLRSVHGVVFTVVTPSPSSSSDSDSGSSSSSSSSGSDHDTSSKKKKKSGPSTAGGGGGALLIKATGLADRPGECRMTSFLLTLLFFSFTNEILSV